MLDHSCALKHRRKLSAASCSRDNPILQKPFRKGSKGAQSQSSSLTCRISVLIVVKYALYEYRAASSSWTAGKIRRFTLCRYVNVAGVLVLKISNVVSEILLLHNSFYHITVRYQTKCAVLHFPKMGFLWRATVISVTQLTRNAGPAVLLGLENTVWRRCSLEVRHQEADFRPTVERSGLVAHHKRLAHWSIDCSISTWSQRRSSADPDFCIYVSIIINNISCLFSSSLAYKCHKWKLYEYNKNENVRK